MKKDRELTLKEVLTLQNREVVWFEYWEIINASEGHNELQDEGAATVVGVDANSKGFSLVTNSGTQVFMITYPRNNTEDKGDKGDKEDKACKYYPLDKNGFLRIYACQKEAQDFEYLDRVYRQSRKMKVAPVLKEASKNIAKLHEIVVLRRHETEKKFLKDILDSVNDSDDSRGATLGKEHWRTIHWHAAAFLRHEKEILENNLLQATLDSQTYLTDRLYAFVKDEFVLGLNGYKELLLTDKVKDAVKD